MPLAEHVEESGHGTGTVEDDIGLPEAGGLTAGGEEQDLQTSHVPNVQRPPDPGRVPAAVWGSATIVGPGIDSLY